EVFTDGHLLQKIMGHLIDNAIKFTNEGKVTFGYSLAGNYLRFFVRDTGIGISVADSESIYDQFHQASNRPDRKYPGTGIGLTIVKNLTQLLDSTIEFESSPGLGSEFYFLLPQQPYLRVVHD
ncbi:MAG: PAS domain-containing sensor histidine kinase, partial [Prolixibacteraceae bacterium]|nr:PAS domain-containing sensor histidine kinase [Prolixibacteraceae bacterium]